MESELFASYQPIIKIWVHYPALAGEPMEKIKGGEHREFIGVLIELFETRDGSMTPCIMLQTTDEKEYRIIEGQDPSRFLRQRVRIIGRLHQTQGEKTLEILQVTPVELNGSLQVG